MKVIKAFLRWLPIIIKYVFGYIFLHLFHRDLLKKDIWLIQEKIGEARDNGYHLFKYIRTNHPEINAYFVITEDSSDLCKVQKYGNLIEHNSKKHILYYLAAKYSIGSQPCGANPYIITPQMFRLISVFRNPEQKCIFLQHGIILNSLPDKKMYYKHMVHDLFVTSTKKERDFVEEHYGYPPGYVQELGLCRFDNLQYAAEKKEKIILLMPTWRSWLRFKVKPSEERDCFKNSEYYQTYVSLLKNSLLKDLLKSYGFKLVFYPHFEAQRHIDLFADYADKNIIIATKEKYDVQDLLMRSSVLITDFSSVFFDFAYMDKPMVFYQFDEEQFRKGHYQEGYFSYRNDGFGKVVKEEKEVIEELEVILKNNCVMDEIYEKRRTEFFDLIDDKNCERNFNAIKSL